MNCRTKCISTLERRRFVQCARVGRRRHEIIAIARAAAFTLVPLACATPAMDFVAVALEHKIGALINKQGLASLSRFCRISSASVLKCNSSKVRTSMLKTD